MRVATVVAIRHSLVWFYFMEKEIWKDIPNYEGVYLVSNFGRIKSFRRNWKTNERILAISIWAGGYRVIKLSDKNRIIKTYKISRLVALTFILNPHNLPEVNHKDGNKLNDEVNNLEWVNRSDNIKHALRIGLFTSRKGEKNSNAKLNNFQVRVIRKINDMYQREIAEIFNISRSQIALIRRNGSWKHVK